MHDERRLTPAASHGGTQVCGCALPTFGVVQPRRAVCCSNRRGGRAAVCPGHSRVDLGRGAGDRPVQRLDCRGGLCGVCVHLPSTQPRPALLCRGLGLEARETGAASVPLAGVVPHRSPRGACSAAAGPLAGTTLWLTWATLLLQTLLYDRLHGFWSPTSQVRHADLEPQRTNRHVSSNISMPAAVRLLTTLATLVAHRARVQNNYLTLAQAELTTARSLLQQRRRRSVAGSPTHSISLESLSSMSSIRPQRTSSLVPKRNSLLHQSSIVELVQLAPVQMSSVPEGQPAGAALQLHTDASAGKARRTGLVTLGLAEQPLQQMPSALEGRLSASGAAARPVLRKISLQCSCACNCMHRSVSSRAWASGMATAG